MDAGVATELFRPWDYASDAVVLRLFSSGSLRLIIQKDSDDTGNAAVLIVTMVMIRMRLFAVNS